MENIEFENKIILDLKIIKKKHELKNIKHNSRYKILKEYNLILKDLKDLLIKQKHIDKDNFLKNLMSIDEFRDEVIKRKKNKALFRKLSNEEKEFIIKNEYDFLNDKLNLLTKKESPICKLVIDWNELKIELFNKSIKD